MDALDRGQIRVLISRSAILHNVKLIRSVLAECTKLCAMVKADAYGHGAAIVADTLVNFSYEGLEGPAVDALAVVTLEEAEALDQDVVPTLVLRPVESLCLSHERQALETAIRNGWTLTVGSPAAACDLGRLAMACGRRASVQVMIDTGQVREGADIASLPMLLAAINSQPALKLSSLCTHFVSAEEPDNSATAEQLSLFHSATDEYGAAHPKTIRHVANSAAIFLWPQSHMDMVRPGLGIYGIDPTCRVSLDRPLRPALCWTVPLVSVRSVRKGQAVGYNQTWRAARDTRIGLVPVGYADGYLRAFGNRAMMMVHGRAAPVVGRVSMDYATIDLGGVPQACVGDEVTVLDSDPLSPASAYSLSRLAGTIPYEIFCHIGQRMPRVAAEPEESAVPQRPMKIVQREAV